MIPFGYLAIARNHGSVSPRRSRLTYDEHYAFMTLLIIMRSPLMFGGDFSYTGELRTSEYDTFYKSFLTNPEAIEITKFSKNNRQLFHTGDTIGWVAEDQDFDDVYLALFYPGHDRPGPANLGPGYEPRKRIFTVNLAELGFTGTVEIRDIWHRKDLGVFSGSEFTPEVDFHGASLFRITPVQ